MPTRFLRRLAEIVIAVVVAIACLSPVPGAKADDAALQPRDLQLEVFINGQPAGLVSQFTDAGDGRLSSPASELRELGIRVPSQMPDTAPIPLDGLEGLSYVYDEPKQSINIEAGDAQRIPAYYRARGSDEAPVVRPSDYGAVLNYSIFASADTTNDFDINKIGFTGANVTLDSRILTPMGIFSNSGIVGTTPIGDKPALRLDTTFTFSDDENLTTWRAGDFISGGVGWTRPIRLGGAQVQRNFSIRPDLITTALPSVTGSAAVPSTVDVFVNGVKSYSQEVRAGPFQIDSLPSINGAGVAHVVTRDASGKETVQTVSFYASPQILKPGLWDFSLETGLPRQAYGRASFEYAQNYMASGTIRYGATDWLTAEAHAEGGDGIFNGGAGVVTRIGSYAVVAAALSASQSNRGSGYQLYGSAQTNVGPASINVRAQHAFDKFDDLASITARTDPYITGQLTGIASSQARLGVPKAVDSATVSVPLTFDNSSLSASIIHYVPDIGKKSDIATLSYSRTLIYGANMVATGYADINDTSTAGIYVGLNMPFGDDISLGAGVQGQLKRLDAFAEASKPLGQEEGSWAWRVKDSEGKNALRSASIATRTAPARIEATVYQDRNAARGTAEVEGAVALLGGDLYASNRIDDSFAVVDAHAPGVKVMRENTVIGTTNDNGKILIPRLSSYQKNKIGIDPIDLPLDAEIDSTFEYVAPAYRSGAYIDFNVKKAAPNALVTLKRPDGSYVPAGSAVQLDGSPEGFVVGYDGQTFIKGLSAVNTIRVTMQGATCTASFTHSPDAGITGETETEICQ